MSGERILTAREKQELAGTVFSHRELVEVDLSEANLRGARFESSKVIGCNLRGADLRDASFVLCDVQRINLADVILGGENQFDGSVFVEVLGLTPEVRALIEARGGTFQPVGASSR